MEHLHYTFLNGTLQGNGTNYVTATFNDHITLGSEDSDRIGYDISLETIDFEFILQSTYNTTTFNSNIVSIVYDHDQNGVDTPETIFEPDYRSMLKPAFEDRITIIKQIQFYCTSNINDTSTQINGFTSTGYVDNNVIAPFNGYTCSMDLPSLPTQYLNNSGDISSVGTGGIGIWFYSSDANQIISLHVRLGFYTY